MAAFSHRLACTVRMHSPRFFVQRIIFGVVSEGSPNLDSSSGKGGKSHASKQGAVITKNRLTATTK